MFCVNIYTRFCSEKDIGNWTKECVPHMYVCVCVCLYAQLLGCVSLFVTPLMTPLIVACQAPLSMVFFRQNTGVGFHVFLQGMFRNQTCFS